MRLLDGLVLRSLLGEHIVTGEGLVRGRNLLSILIGIVRIAASLGFVWICKRLVDIATGVLDAPLPLHIGILLGVMMLQLICSVSASAWESYNTVRTGNGLRQDTFKRVLHSSWTGLEAYRSGDAVNRLEDDPLHLPSRLPHRPRGHNLETINRL